MNERSERISKLLKNHKSRTAYIKAKLAVLVPAQIRTLRLNSVIPPMPFQRDLAQESDLHQSRISMFETPGASNMTIETIAKIAAGLRVGVVVKFVPFSEMLKWENSFSPDTFDVTRLDRDEAFLNPSPVSSAGDGYGGLGESCTVINEAASVLSSPDRRLGSMNPPPVDFAAERAMSA